MGAGQLRAVQVQSAHYADDRPRKTKRGNWRVYEAELNRFLATLRASGKALPASAWRTEHPF